MPHFFRHFAPIVLSSLSRSRSRSMRPTTSFVPVRAGKVKATTTEWSGSAQSRDEYMELGEWREGVGAQEEEMKMGGRVKVQGREGAWRVGRAVV